MKPIALCLLLLISNNICTSDYEYPSDYEYLCDDDDENTKFTEPYEFNPRQVLIEITPENPELFAAIAANAPLEHIIHFLDLGANIESQNPSGERPLHAAIKQRNIPLVEELLRRNANVNSAPPLIASTPLHIATNSLEENIIIVKKLLEHGANINATDLLGFTALHYASIKGHTETVKFLLECNADTTKEALAVSNTPANEAKLRGFLEIADLIDNWAPDIKGAL